jgi:integrase/recombinase XerD
MAKRRHFTDQFKAKVSLEALRGDKTVQGIVEKHQLHPNQVSTWKRQATDRMTDVFSGGKQRGPTEAEVKELMPRSGGWRSRKINLFDETGAIRERFVLDASQTKGAKTCTVWINAKVRRQLELFSKHLLSKHTNDALFQSQKGGAFSANTMTQLFLNIYRAAGFENASSHSGRRTFITELASKGVSVRVLAELAGQSSIQTTQRHIDVNPQQMSAAVELL